jgi:hypothetical protein
MRARHRLAESYGSIRPVAGKIAAARARRLRGPREAGMSFRTLRRLLLGFVLGTAAGWLAGLLRTPQHAPAGSSAADAAALPQERFGDAPGDLWPTPDPGTTPIPTRPEPPVPDNAPEPVQDSVAEPKMAAAPADPKAAADEATDLPSAAPAAPKITPPGAAAPRKRRATAPRTKPVKGTATAGGTTTGDIAADADQASGRAEDGPGTTDGG